MSVKFLAEDFRQLLNRLESISEADKDNNKDTDDNNDQDKPSNVDDLLTAERPEGISKDDIKTVHDLVEYLDQFPELSEWRNPNAEYDDAYYDHMPLDAVQQYASLSDEDLERIGNEFEPNKGSVLTVGDTVSIYGED